MRDFRGPAHVEPHPTFERWYAPGGAGSGRGFLLAEIPEGTPGVVRVNGRVYLLAFTAPDRARAFAVGLGKLRATVLGGAELFARATGRGIEGVALDAGSPSSSLLSLERCRALARAALVDR